MDDLKQILKKETNEKIKEVLEKAILECSSLILDDIGVDNFKIHYYGMGNFREAVVLDGEVVECYDVTDSYLSINEYSQLTNSELQAFKKQDDLSLNIVVNNKMYFIPDYSEFIDEMSYNSFIKILDINCLYK